jgi:2-oxoglutarate dehydrogenase E2 component (dihydrolipoamide succinyltransferase)
MDITVPSIGESIKTGTLAVWLKQDGESVAEGDGLFELETEKSTIEFPSPANGVLHVDIEAGEEVEVGQKVGILDTDASLAIDSTGDETASDDEDKSPVDTPISPAARRLINEAGLDPSTIEGSGKGGRITKADAEAAVKTQETANTSTREKASVSTPAAPPQPAAPEPPTTAPAQSTPASVTPDGRSRRRVPMTSIRKRTAQRLVQAKQETAYTTTFNEIDMQKVISIRGEYKESFEKEHGIRIGFMSFFVKAACQALKQYPVINAMVDGEDIVYQEYYDIGIAISLEKGLLVPVIRNADRLSFASIELGISDLAQRAKAKRLLPDELQGGTFTITNGGVFGSMLSTPIPAFPQTAILGMHSIQKRAVVVDDEICIRPVMYVALTYDHRIVDGRDAIGFLAKIKAFIEDPDKLLLEL